MHDQDQLDYLMGCYFHEDFDETGGLQGTLDVYFAEASAGMVRGLVDAIGELLSQVDQDSVLRSTLKRMGCAVYLEGTTGYRDWLLDIQRRAREHLSTNT